MSEARAAWRAYWARSYALFQRFQAGGSRGYERLRNKLASGQDLHHLLADHRTLCACLRAAAAEEAGSLCGSLMHAVVELIDAKGSLSWEQLPELLQEQATALSRVPPRVARTHRRGSSVDRASLGGERPHQSPVASCRPWREGSPDPNDRCSSRWQRHDGAARLCESQSSMTLGRTTAAIFRSPSNSAGTGAMTGGPRREGRRGTKS